MSRSPSPDAGLHEVLRGMHLEDLVDLAVAFGTTPDAFGESLADAGVHYSWLSEEPAEMRANGVAGNEQLPRLNIEMSQEEQEDASVKYREWFEGKMVPEGAPLSSPSLLVTLQASARREQDRQAVNPLPKGEARTFVSVTGFRKHSSTTPWVELTETTFSELRMHQAATGRYVLCRIIAPCTSLFSVQTVVEDERGNAYDLSIYNFPATFDATPDYVDLLFPKGAVLLIRDPTLLPSQQSPNPLLRVDSPTDIVMLSPHSELIPQLISDWHFTTPAPASPSALSNALQPLGEEYWKTEGNERFKASHWLPAAVTYSFGLKCHPDSLVLRLNRAEAYLRLGWYSGALHDAQAVLSAPGFSEALRNKAIFRAARAEYGRRNYERAKSLFQQHKAAASNNGEDAEWIRRCGQRLQERSMGRYDWARLFEESQKSNDLDCADYTGSVQVREVPGRGRGVVATVDIQPGELLMVSKAFSLVEEKDLRDEVWRAALNIKTSEFMTRSQCANVAKVVQTLYGNPDLHDRLFHLYAGPGYPPPPATYPPPAFQDLEPLSPLEPTLNIDIDKLEAICTFNGFDQYTLRSAGCAPIENDMQRSPNAIHLLPSLLNHSCVGNARSHVIGDIIAIRAIAPIKAGEEVMIPYMAAGKSYKERCRILRRYFPGDCDCSLCDMDRADGEAALAQRERILGELPQAALYQESFARLYAWEKELIATYAPPRGTFKPALARIYHALGEKLRSAGKLKEALKANIKGLSCEGFIVTDGGTTSSSPSSSASLKRKLRGLPINMSSLPLAADLERCVVAMMRIAQQLRVSGSIADAKRWMRAAQYVVNLEYGGEKTMFLQLEGAVLRGIGMQQFAELHL